MPVARRPSALSKALREIEKTLPAKLNVFTTANKVKAKKTSKKVLAKDGRNCVAALKEILPKMTLPELKKMFKAAGLKDPPADKDKIAEQLVGHILPGYPYAKPYGPTISTVQDDDDEDEEDDEDDEDDEDGDE